MVKVKGDAVCEELSVEVPLAQARGVICCSPHGEQG